MINISLTVFSLLYRNDLRGWDQPLTRILRNTDYISLPYVTLRFILRKVIKHFQNRPFQMPPYEQRSVEKHRL